MYEVIKKDRKLKFIFLFSLILQCWFGYYQIGFFHPDQHFQIIEFSSFQLNKPSYATSIWEFNDKIRPTLQVYFFSGFRLVCNSFGIENNFTIIRIIQLFTGLLSFYIFNKATFFFLKDEPKKVFYWVVIFINLSWCFAYVRSLYSSETYSSVLFFGALIFYLQSKSNSETKSIFTGFLLALSFYCRFQMAFAIVGFGVYSLLIEKCYKKIFHLFLGFLLGIILNVLLDYFFYQQWVFTPYNYFQKNIVEGVANSFGTSSFLKYIVILAVIVSAPFYSLILFFVGLKSSIKNLKHPLVLSVLFFIIGHCLVGHKEERFLYPIFCVVPIIIGFQLNDYINYVNKQKGIFKYLFSFIKYFGIALNCFLLVVFSFTPYSQTVFFSSKLNDSFKEKSTEILFVDRSCLQTESHLQMKYYEESMNKIKFIKVNNIDTISNFINNKYFITTFNQLDDTSFKVLKKLGFKPKMSSSMLLWNLNIYLKKRQMNSINDIWMLYERP